MDTFGIELAKKTTTSKYILCSCVNFAKFIIHGTAYLGTSWGYAGNMKPQHKKPKIGDVILLEGHVGVVVNFDDQNITFTESNYESCKKTIRTLPINDGSIRGYSTL